MSSIKFPKNTNKLFWTKHVIEKMQYYNLSESRLRRLLNNPSRIEQGIAPNTIAVMQPTGSKKHPTEIWLMYCIDQKTKKKKIITAWRYPGISPNNKPPKVPEDIIKELNLSLSAS